MTSNIKYVYFNQPKVKTTTITYDRFLIKDIRMNLNSSAKINVVVFSADINDTKNDKVICKLLEMKEEDYAKWGTDDSYLEEFIKNNINLD